MSYDAISRRAADTHLQILGAFHPGSGDGAPEGTGTLILLGPREPGFWSHLIQTPEFTDRAPDPVDRWSTRVITALAAAVGGTPLFPFGGAPYQPFLHWAAQSRRARPSPVTLLVHDTAGLMVSYRGALALPDRLDLPPAPASPCTSCGPQPCRSACPVNALDGSGYDTSACHAYLDTDAGRDCLLRGCAVRRACPVSQRYGRDEAQSAYHMGIFHR